jgi:hypothetical protein
MEPIVIVEGEDLARLFNYFDDARQGPRPYRLRFAIDGGIKIKVNEDVWTIDFGQIEVPARDLCPRCGGDHDRIDRRDPCPGEMRIMLDGVEVGRGIPKGQASYVFWNRVRLTTPLIPRREIPPHVEPVRDDSDLYDLAPAYRLLPIREGER